MESFRIGKWEMIGWEFLPADMAAVSYTHLTLPTT